MDTTSMGAFKKKSRTVSRANKDDLITSGLLYLYLSSGVLVTETASFFYKTIGAKGHRLKAQPTLLGKVL